mmetsp:Transcript_138092/g.327181  ORF Transcript_138092/g.327181 Transcript_138092/m.327181 type:complete len:243 (-) Transcript_138092:70-798(-)
MVSTETFMLFTTCWSSLNCWFDGTRNVSAFRATMLRSSCHCCNVGTRSAFAFLSTAMRNSLRCLRLGTSSTSAFCFKASSSLFREPKLLSALAREWDTSSNCSAEAVVSLSALARKTSRSSCTLGMASMSAFFSRAAVSCTSCCCADNTPPMSALPSTAFHSSSKAMALGVSSISAFSFRNCSSEGVLVASALVFTLAARSTNCWRPTTASASALAFRASITSCSFSESLAGSRAAMSMATC